MISRLTGPVVAVGATHVVIDCAGFGMLALCPPATAAAVRPGEIATLHTTLIVREDSLTLYGFLDEQDRAAFEVVQSVTGIGPKIAQAVVSVMSADDLRNAILTENLTALCAVPGIGRKGAQRMVLELKDKVLRLGEGGATPSGSVPAVPETPEWREQVASGLQGLGWSQRDAEAACDRISPLADEDPQIGVAALMKAALRSLAK